MDVHSKQDLKGSKAIRVLGEKLAEMEGQPLRREGVLYSNIDRLSEEVGLTTVDKEVLAFVALLHTQACLRECASLFDDVSTLTAKDVLAEVLGLDRAEIRRALKEDSTLCSSGIIRLDRTETELAGMLDLLEGLDTALLGDAGDSRTMFRAYFSPADPSSLTPADFPHLREDFSLLRGILAKAMDQSLNWKTIHGRHCGSATKYIRLTRLFAAGSLTSCMFGHPYAPFAAGSS